MDSAELLTEQALPTPNAGPSVQEMVIADIRVRMQVGLERYGTLLQPGNGRDALRDALRDAYEEAVDLAMYLRQAIAERDATPRVCVDCHRAARELEQGVDGEWRGPSCHKRHIERGTGVQLPIDQEGGDSRAQH